MAVHGAVGVEQAQLTQSAPKKLASRRQGASTSKVCRVPRWRPAQVPVTLWVPMCLVLYHFRTTFGHRWRRYVGIVLLLGILAGVSMFAIAGARRTQSAYPRFLRSINASTMATDVGAYDADFAAAVAKFPEVRNTSTYIASFVAPLVDGKPDLSVSFESLGSLDGRFFEQDRFTPTKGRLPDPTRIDEVAVNEYAARKYGYRVP